MTDTLNALQAERAPLAARLDAIELAESNLKQIWAPDDAPDRRGVVRRPVKERRLGPRRAQKAKRGIVAPKPVEPKPMSAATSTSEAGARREQLLALISKAEVGLTIGQLRNATPKMDIKDRQNALSTLKAKGEIRRSGNTWVKAT